MGNSVQILLAEDEEHIAQLIKFKLGKDGYQVTIAKNGEEAIEYISKNQWALLILDVMMPIHDGWKVLETLRNSPQSEVPVLMLTAKSYQKDIAKASELGATQFLKKPFDPKELSEVVRTLLESA